MNVCINDKGKAKGNRNQLEWAPTDQISNSIKINNEKKYYKLSIGDMMELGNHHSGTIIKIIQEEIQKLVKVQEVVGNLQNIEVFFQRYLKIINTMPMYLITELYTLVKMVKMINFMHILPPK